MPGLVTEEVRGSGDRCTQIFSGDQVYLYFWIRSLSHPDGLDTMNSWSFKPSCPRLLLAGGIAISSQTIGERDGASYQKRCAPKRLGYNLEC